VPTTFSQNIFINNGVNASKIRVVGEPIDTDFYMPVDISSLSSPSSSLSLSSSSLSPLIKYRNENKFIFLFVGKWESRKGVRILLRAFFTEFNDDDDVILTVVTSAYHSTSDFMGEIKKTLITESLSVSEKMLSKLIVISSVPQRSMPLLYSLANILVIPSHGEGWGRPHVESMSCGTPVIATYWSGPTEFLTVENGYPLNHNGLIPTPNWDGHNWANPDESHLRSLLRHAYENPDEVKEKGKVARNDMMKYSLANMGQIVHDEIERYDYYNYCYHYYHY